MIFLSIILDSVFSLSFVVLCITIIYCFCELELILFYLNSDCQLINGKSHFFKYFFKFHSYINRKAL